LKQNFGGLGPAIVDPPAIVALVGAEDPKLRDTLEGNLGNGEAVLVDAPGRQSRR
jgi:hypothetical protein